MNIGSLAGQLYNAINNAVNNQVDGTQGTGTAQTNIDPMLKNGLEILSDMSIGDIISGEIVKTDGSNILLSLGNNAAIEAQLQQGINATEGQLMSFLIKGNDANKISLSPLYANMNSNPTADSALTAAGLPVTEKMQYMVKSMMEEGLPIDKQSLYDMNKVMSANPEIDPLDLARMKRLNIPLTDDMIKQFESYKNYEHELTNALSDITESLSESLSQVFSGEGAAEAVKLFDNLMNILLPENETQEAKEALLSDKESLPVKENIEEKAENVNDKAITENTDTAKGESILTDKQLNSLLNELKSGGFSEELINGAKSGSIPENELLKRLLEELNNKSEFKDGANIEDKAQLLNKLTDNEGFKELLKNDLNKQWLLKPEDVAEDGKVSKLYEKLNEQVKTLTDALTSEGKQDTPIFQAANNVSQNIDFMNQVNQTFNYVQIPLQMANGEKAGELYVYTNKKSLAEKDGNVSALLHLDMEYLGPMDVHVAMSEYSNVRTQFYLKDDASLDLIAGHIDMLNERLNKRGYNMSAEFINKDEHKSLIDNMTESSGNVPIYSQTSFDIRA